MLRHALCRQGIGRALCPALLDGLGAATSGLAARFSSSDEPQEPQPSSSGEQYSSGEQSTETGEETSSSGGAGEPPTAEAAEASDGEKPWTKPEDEGLLDWALEEAIKLEKEERDKKPDRREVENMDVASLDAELDVEDLRDMEELSRADEFTQGPTEYISMAPPGQPGWHLLDVDEDNATSYWACDLTGGAIPGIERNALLSDDAKAWMYRLHKDPEQQWDVPALAATFRVRQQRVMAILALKQLEEEAAASEEPLFEELADVMENELWDCVWEQGTGERHVVRLPNQPIYETVDIPDGSRFKPGDMASEIDAVEEELAIREEAILVKEFKEALDWNLGKTGKTISRKSRRKHAPKRPEGGWSIVVTPIGKAGGKPYVAKPDGSQRSLTEDEQLYLDRMKPRPRRRIA